MILTAPERGKKISDGIVRQIRDAVMSGELKLGDKIGSEKDLMAQLNVSKSTLREALRVLESMGIIEIRKGLSGGVFVAEVDMKTTLAGVLNFLNFQSVSIRDITMVRYILEPAIIRIAVPLVTEEDIGRIEALIRGESGIETAVPIAGIGFHRYLARITHNPILILVMDFIDNLVADIKLKESLGSDFYEAVTAYHQRTLDCIRKRDAAGAITVIQEDILFVGRYMADRLNHPIFKPETEDRAVPDLPIQDKADGDLRKIAARREAPHGTVDSTEVSPQKLILRHVASGQLYAFEPDDKIKG
jgi:GntR family transcriptional regulator, transcriptional repressor for pyruvate dehydrogenase complex